MNQCTIKITARADRLNIPREIIHARQLHSVIAHLVALPDDVTSVVLRVFKVDGVSHFDIPVSRSRGCGYPIGIAYIIGTCFPDAGAARYEIHAYDARGNMTALGSGLINIEPFTETGAPIAPGQSVPIMQIADETGALHTIKAIADEQGNFTTVVDA